MSNCIYKSVDMVAGEVFILPPGAEVIGVTNDSVTSSCGNDLPTVELACFYMQWAINIDPEGDRFVFSPLTVTAGIPPIGPGTMPIHLPKVNNAWDPDDDETSPSIIVTNIGVAGQVIPGGMSCQDFTSIESAILVNAANGLVTNRKWLHEDRFDSISALTQANFLLNSYGDSGYILYGLWFKAIKEIGETVYIEIQGNSGNTGTPTRYYAQLMDDCSEYPTTSEVASSGTVNGITSTTTTSTTTTTTIIT